MCKPTTAEEFRRARRLHELGVAVDYEAFERMRTESAGLSILQNGDLPSLILDMPAGQTGCLFNMAIANESERQVLAANWIRFEGPEWLTDLRLIPDPRSVKGSKYPNQYFLRADECGYPRETVLNNFVRGKAQAASRRANERMSTGDSGLPYSLGLCGSRSDQSARNRVRSAWTRGIASFWLTGRARAGTSKAQGINRYTDHTAKTI